MSGPYEGEDVRREIGTFAATSIVIANIIGAGIFTTTGIIAGFLPGPGWVLACWILGGAIAMAGALCYAELATRMPDEGGEYLYLSRLYHPLLGFLTGWTSFFVGFSAPIAASAMGFSEYLFPSFGGALAGIDPVLVRKAVSIAVIASFTILHWFGLRAGSRVQNVLTAVKILIVAGIAGAGLAGVGASAGGSASPAAGGSGGAFAFGTAMMLVMFSYSGWNASAYIAGELRRPGRTIPVSLVSGTAVVIALYLAVNLFVLRALPYGEIGGTIAIVEKAAVAALGPWMGRALGILVAVALLSSLSAFIIIGPRVYFAMARDRLFFPFAARVHPRHGVPGRSILIQGGLAAAMVIAGSFEQLMVYLGFALGIFPWLAVAGIFIARRRGIGEETAVRTPLFPAVPLFFLAVTLVLMIVAFVNRPMESAAAIVTVIAGIPCYFLWKRVVGGRSDAEKY
ncbi:MAG: amino acid permease [Candidatus Krumholzibacteria bacterium]|nr:amino acid permease [Candidatus Krumholzibacteria bacterium]